MNHPLPGTVTHLTRALLMGASAVTLVACSSPGSQLAGTWVGTCGDNPAVRMGGQPISFTFGPDGIFNTREQGEFGPVNDGPGHYTVSGEQLTMVEQDYISPTHTQTAHFSVTDNILNLDAAADLSRPGERPVWCTFTRGQL